MTGALMELRIKARELVERVEALLDQHLAGSSVPTVPDSPPDPLHPHRKDPGSAKYILPLTLMLTGAGAWAFAPEGRPMDGMQALRNGDYERAEHHFRSEGNTLRVAESWINQGRLEEADRLLAPVDTPAAIRLRGIVAMKRGEQDVAMPMLDEAAGRGDVVALRLAEAVRAGTFKGFAT